MNSRRPSPTPASLPKCTIGPNVRAKDCSQCESQRRAMFQCLTNSLPILSISLVEECCKAVGRAAETWGWGVSAASSGRKGLQLPPVHPKSSLSSSRPLYNFQTPFVYCWHFFLSSVVAVYKGRKNTQLEYTKIPLGINRNFFSLYSHRMQLALQSLERK